MAHNKILLTMLGVLVYIICFIFVALLVRGRIPRQLGDYLMPSVAIALLMVLLVFLSRVWRR
jgi:K+-transporting ATPase A subunit